MAAAAPTSLQPESDLWISWMLRGIGLLVVISLYLDILAVSSGVGFVLLGVGLSCAIIPEAAAIAIEANIVYRLTTAITRRLKNI